MAFDSQLLFVQAGSVYGETPAALTGGNAIPVFDISFTPLEGSVLPRSRADSEGGELVKSAVTGKMARIEFSMYLCGSNTAGTVPLFNIPLLACGTTLATVAGVSNTYSLASLNSSLGFCHFTFHHDGIKYKLYNSRGEVEITMNPGSLPVAKFSMMALYSAPTTLPSITAPVYPASALPLAVDAVNTAQFSMGTAAVPVNRQFSAFSLKFGNEIVLKDDGGPGGARIHLASRKPTASVTTRHTGLDDQNVFTNFAGEIENQLTLVHGAANNRITINFPRFCFGNIGSPEDSNNETYWKHELTLLHDPGQVNYFTIMLD